MLVTKSNLHISAVLRISVVAILSRLRRLAIFSDIPINRLVLSPIDPKSSWKTIFSNLDRQSLISTF